MVANFLHMKFTFVYIYIIFMLHFVKNEDEVKITMSHGNSKLEFFLYTTNEAGKKFYELLKEKKTMELTFSFGTEERPFALASYEENNFKLIADDTEVPPMQNMGGSYLFANHDGLGMFFYEIQFGPESDRGFEAMIIGQCISTPESINNFFILNSEPNSVQDSINLVFALKENQGDYDYNLNLLLLIILLIFIILLIVCLLSK